MAFLNRLFGKKQNSSDHSLITPEFAKYARLLNDLPHSSNARHFYELMSGALMWEDEKAQLPFSELGWFRAAQAYRSSLILGKPRTEFEPIWTALQKIAPNWPGFREERCKPDPELIAFLKKKKTSLPCLNVKDGTVGKRPDL